MGQHATNDYIRAAIGEHGGTRFADTDAHTGGDWLAIQVLTDATFDTLTGNLAGTVTGVTYTAGTILFGVFTALTLSGGSVIAYNRKALNS